MNWLQLILNYMTAQSVLVPNRDYINTTNGRIVRINEGKVKIHAFQPAQYVVSTYIIELPSKLVVIDFQISPADAANFLQYARTLNKPIDHGILTHYHFDHWLGVESFENTTPIYALPETIGQLRDVYVNGRENAFKTKAAEFLKYLKPIDLGLKVMDGVEFYFEKIAATENPYSLMVRLPAFSVMVAGDLVNNQRHVYLAEVSDFSRWISTLEAFLKTYPYRNVLVGHGDPSGPQQIRENIEYLNFVRNIANNFKSLAQYRASILKQYPSYPNEGIVDCPFTNFNCIFGVFQ
jgi:glyoxylase-like metal-dependent hydrolase (beta-lactamase superfamily II)